MDRTRFNIRALQDVMQNLLNLRRRRICHTMHMAEIVSIVVACVRQRRMLLVF